MATKRETISMHAPWRLHLSHGNVQLLLLFLLSSLMLSVGRQVVVIDNQISCSTFILIFLPNGATRVRWDGWQATDCIIIHQSPKGE